MKGFIPLYKPFTGESEKEALLQVLSSGNMGGNGKVCREVERYMQELFQVNHVLLTTSCAHAMELATMVLDIGRGCEVILPSFTFVTTATSVVRQGAKPVFAEIEEEMYNLDPADVERLITAKTRAIMPVHYAGQDCRMDEILRIARDHHLYVIEDAAQGVGAKYGGQYLGTIGDIGCYSFHVTKNVTCGEGDAFLTQDEEKAK